jgi:hypothetical protein
VRRGGAFYDLPGVLEPYLPGAEGPVVAPGRLREVVARHEHFGRMLQEPAPANGQVFVEDGGYSDWTAASSRSSSSSPE